MFKFTWHKHYYYAFKEGGCQSNDDAITFFASELNLSLVKNMNRSVDDALAQFNICLPISATF